MTADTKNQNGEPPETEQVLRHWVELRDLENSSTRILPVTAKMHVHLVKGQDVPMESEQILQLTDGSTVLEARDLEGLAAQLGPLYPDGKFNRTLHAERDHEAEQRRRRALDDLGRVFAEAAVEQLLRDEEAGTKG